MFLSLFLPNIETVLQKTSCECLFRIAVIIFETLNTSFSGIYPEIRFSEFFQ